MPRKMKKRAEPAAEEPPAKRTKVFSDDDDSDDDGQNGVSLVDASFSVNEEYAKRFEYNKKREEKQRCTFYSLHSLTVQLANHI